MTPLVELAGVVKGYQDGERRTEVLRGVDMLVGRGEAVAVVGPSGAGKSTLLHLIGALDACDEGVVRVAGDDLARLDGRRLARFRNRQVGFVFQFQELLPDFTAAENVAVPARIAGRSREQAMAAAEEALTAVGLGDLGHRFPAQLSGGERQRVGVCRALINHPPLVLADEPTGSLDHEHGQQVMDILLQLREAHDASLILVTHDRDTAALCGRVLTLRDGRLA